MFLASIDGATALTGEPTSLEPLFEGADRLVTWPGPEAPVFLQTHAGRLYELSPAGHWNPSLLPSGLVGPTFVG